MLDPIESTVDSDGNKTDKISVEGLDVAKDTVIPEHEHGGFDDIAALMRALDGEDTAECIGMRLERLTGPLWDGPTYQLQFKFTDMLPHVVIDETENGNWSINEMRHNGREGYTYVRLRYTGITF